MCKGLQMIQFECPRHQKPSVSFSFEVGRTPFSHYWPSGVIRIGLPVWKWKSLKNFATKGAQPAANDPIWTPQAPKPLCITPFQSWQNLTSQPNRAACITTIPHFTPFSRQRPIPQPSFLTDFPQFDLSSFVSACAACGKILQNFPTLPDRPLWPSRWVTLSIKRNIV